MIEDLLTSFEGLLILGTAVGIITALLAPTGKIGCATLLIIPIGMMSYIDWWQGQHPENLRSTSALDYIFGPLWPSAGAILGFYGVKVLRMPNLRP